MHSALFLSALATLLTLYSARAAVVQVPTFGGNYPLNVSTEWFTTVGPETRFDAGGSFQYRETVEYLGFTSGGLFLGGYDLGPALRDLESIGPQTQWRTLLPQAQAVSVHKVEARPRPLPLGGYNIVDNVTQILNGSYAIRVSAADGVHYGWLQFTGQTWDDFTSYRTSVIMAYLEESPNTPVALVPEPGGFTLSALLAVAFTWRRSRVASQTPFRCRRLPATLQG